MTINGEVIYKMSHMWACARVYTHTHTHTHTHTNTHTPCPTLPDLPMVGRVRFSSGYGIKPNLTFSCEAFVLTYGFFFLPSTLLDFFIPFL